MLLAWCLLGSFIVFLCPASITDKLGFLFVRTFGGPLRLGRGITLAKTRLSSADAAARQRRRYENHLANLRQQLLQERRKVEQLAAMRARLPLGGAALVPAEVVVASLQPSRSQIIINRGRNDGVAVNQFVLADNSIIGTVCQVNARLARVKLLDDPTSRIEVEIEGLRIARVLEGAGGGVAKIGMVSTEHKIKEGAKVFVRKKPGLLDAPVIIGTVKKCSVDAEKPLLWDITVEPACNLSTVTSVSVLVMNPRGELRM